MKKYKFTIRGHNYDVEILGIEDNVADIEVNGTKYAVEVHHEIKQPKTPVFLRSRVPAPTRSETKIKKDIRGTVSIKSPLPGNIMQVFVKEDDEVKKGDLVVELDPIDEERNVRKAEVSVIQSKARLDKAKKNLEINETRFREGLSKSTDVIDARLLYEGAEVERLKSLYDYYIALSDLYLATGNAQKAVETLSLAVTK